MRKLRKDPELCEIIMRKFPTKIKRDLKIIAAKEQVTLQDFVTKVLAEYVLSYNAKEGGEIKTVLLDDGTVGEVNDAEAGQHATVELQDENGLPIEVDGEVLEILEEYRGI